MQGRIKRDGGAAGDPEQRGAAERAAQPRRPDETAEPATASPQASGPGRGALGKYGSKVAMRNWRITTRLVSLLALPVVAATTLGAYRIQDSLANVGQFGNVGSLAEVTQRATELAAALQDERDASAGPLAGTPRNTGSDGVVASREETDRARNAFDSASETLPSDLTGVDASLQAISRQLDNLAEIRRTAYTDDQYVAESVIEYDQLIQSLLSLSQDMAQATNNPGMIKATRALAAFSAAKEYDSIQRAMIGAALAGDRKFRPNDWRYEQAAWRGETSSLQQFQSLYGATASEELLKALDGGNDTITEVDREQRQVAASESGIENFEGSYRDWDDEAKAKIDAMSRIETSLLHEMRQTAQELRNAAQRDALVGSTLALLVLGISLAGAFVVARSMIRSLRRLQDTAKDVAQRRLPELVKHLSESDPQDVDTSVVSIGIHSDDEIGQVASAFDEVHREAVRLASEQALLRGNVNAMFTNLSRRSQGLIQRQLSLISELESREADPDQLSSLFKLDHLATRMRRNGENLLVLAGEEPGRRWTRPVPLVDVLRAAASEVEQYERIELTSVPPAEVTGRVVNDLVHLLAELLENATSFSSPQTKVRVTGHALPDGRVLIEIHDTGIGLSPEDLSAINERLANPPTVDVSVSRRMGLFVVGRLSLRHGIRIQLRPSDSGGTTALVMLPVDITQGGKQVPGQGRAGADGTGTDVAPNASVSGALAAARGLRGGPQRAQVGGSEPRPAIAAGSPGGSGGPQGGRPDTPHGGGFEAPAAQRTNPGWADGQGGGRPAGPGRPAGSGTGYPQPQPTAASADTGFPAGAPGAARGPQAGDTGAFEAVPHPRPQGDPADTAPLPRFPHPQSPEYPAYPAAGDTGPAAAPHASPAGGVPGWATANPAYADPPYAAERPQPTGPGIRSEAGAAAGFQRSDVFQSPQHGSRSARRRAPDADRQAGTHGGPAGFQQPAQPGATAPRPHALGPAGLAGPAGQSGPAGLAGPVGPAGGQTGQTGQDGHAGPRADGDARDGRDGNRHPGASAPLPSRPAAPRQRPANTASGHPVEPEYPHNRGPELPPAGEPMALPPAPVRPDERSPIFEALESDWFRTGRAERMQQIQVSRAAAAAEAGTAGDAARNGTHAPAAGEAPASRRPAPGPYDALQRERQRARSQAAQPPQGLPPRREAHDAQDARETRDARGTRETREPRDTGDTRETASASSWRGNPNDEVWQRAEQVRAPSAGGLTSSGLPRRVPRANLVPGGATQQTPQTGGGPQVSRSPDDVRGRLTNLRRGIQQGRQAGTGTTRGQGPQNIWGGTTQRQEH